MKLISHRGNLNKPDQKRENQVWAIEECIAKGYKVEVDLWLDDLAHGRCFLSHNTPKQKDEISLDWLIKNQYNLLVHCKNKEAVEFAIEYLDGDWFCHDKDRWAGTKDGKLICYSTVDNLIIGLDTILMMPEHHGIEPKDVNTMKIGYVCTDYIERWQ